MSKQKQILEAIFKIPTQSNVVWKDCEKLLKSLGAEISEGAGSRIRVVLNGVIPNIINKLHFGCVKALGFNDRKCPCIV